MGNFFDLKFGWIFYLFIFPKKKRKGLIYLNIIAFTAFVQFPSITVSSIGSICSISMFNFFGLTITKVMSATAR